MKSADLAHKNHFVLKSMSKHATFDLMSMNMVDLLTLFLPTTNVSCYFYGCDAFNVKKNILCIESIDSLF